MSARHEFLPKRWTTRYRYLTALAGLSIGLGLTSCGSSGAGPDDGTSRGGASADDPDPEWSSEARAAVELLAPPRLLPPPADKSNAFADNPDAAAFGQRIFFDTGFSGKLNDGDNNGGPGTLGIVGETGKVSCASCHVPSAGFLDNRSPSQQISLASGWGLRRSPSLLDVGHAKLLMWDGRRDALYNQVFGALESPVEMNSSRLYMAEQIHARYRADYEAIFGSLPPLDDPSRFPAISAEKTGCTRMGGEVTPVCDGPVHGVPTDGAEFDGLSVEDQNSVNRVVANVGKALGAYERLLSCGPSRFDDFVHGDDTALTRAEQRGAILFVGSANCVRCHSGPLMTDQKFHNVGMRPEFVAVVFRTNDDRGAATGLPAALNDPLNVRGAFSDGDDGRLPTEPLPETLEAAFRTPALRCASLRPSFMHTGQLRRLEDVVTFFDRGGDSYGYLGENEISPLGLSARERADLVSFLKALEGPGPDASLVVKPKAP